MVVAKQIATYLQAQGIGTIGTDLFYGYLPDKTGLPLVCVLDTGGMRPDIDLPTKRPTFQVFVRGATFVSGKEKIEAIRALLHQSHNTTLVANQTFFYYIYALSEGGHIGRNASGQDEFSMNFEALTR